MEDFFTSEPSDTLVEPLPATTFYPVQSNSGPLPGFGLEVAQDREDEEWGEPQEDQVTRRIRQQQELVHSRLSQKAAQEFQLKNRRRQQGNRQLQQYNSGKERELEQRKKENLQSEQRQVLRLRELSKTGGWQKVVSNIRTRQGQHQKQVSRMRESILHRRQDEKQ